MFQSRVLHVIVLVPLMVAMVLAGCPVQAQATDPESHPLIQMMSVVPTGAATVTLPEYLQIQYADIRANEQARPGVPTPATWESLMALDDDQRNLWVANANRLIGLAPELRGVHVFDADMASYLGFDYFEIDRSFYFGRPPDDGVIYGGHFDPDRIIDTLVGRAYTLDELDGIPLLCGPVGCENGRTPDAWLPDQTDIDPETLKRSGMYYVFGGRLGRQQPIAMLPGYLYSAPGWETLNAMTSAVTDAELSLYDLPDFRAIADYAVAGDSSLIQVIYFAPQFSDPGFLEWMVLGTLGADASPEDVEALAAQLGVDETGKLLDAEDLPAYSLGALVDHQEGSEQVHRIVLCYATEDDAEQAATEVVRRIPLQSAYPEWGEEGALIDLALTDYTLDAPAVVHSPEADRWLAVATVRTPMPGNDPGPESTFVTASGRLISLWYRSILSSLFMPAQLTPSGD